MAGKSKTNAMINIVLGLAGVCVTIAIIWGVIWFGKKVSYTFMYEGMVKQTIVQDVKQECLVSK